MDISVIATTYNQCEEYINDCIDSIYSQTLRAEDFEVILIDDHSTNPETIQTLKNLKNKYPLIKVVRNDENIGPNLTRKEALKYTSGKFIFFIDGDDLLTRDALETLYIRARLKNSEIVTGEFYRYNGVTKSYNKPERYYKTAPGNHIEKLKLMLSAQLGSFSMCNCLIKRSLLSNDIFDMPERIFHEDQVNWIRLIFKCKSLDKVYQQTYYYRWNQGSITSYFSEKHARSIFYAFNDWLKLAHKNNLYYDLSPYIIHGISKLIDFYIRRAIIKHSDPIERIVEVFLEESKKLNITLIVENRKGLRLLNDIRNQRKITAKLVNELKIKHDIQEPRIKYLPDSKLDFGIGPSDIANELKNKVVFVCDVDYHVKSAIKLSDHLSKKGYVCVILDNSNLIAEGKRKSCETTILKGKSKIIEVQSLPYPIDALALASLVICYNDFNMNTRDALEFRFIQKKPTACIVEGISDFRRVDFYEARYLSYRRCETIFLAGTNDIRHFQDRRNYVIGLPIIESLSKKKPIFPPVFSATLNVNFTYGCLEDKRDFFIEEAEKAFNDLECQWVISRHPMDNGNFENLPLSNKTQYELIDESSVFISRFATGIIEALASGKPAIYFNPHGEKVDKFKNPLGAFYIANNTNELIESIQKVQQDISNNVDFRHRAAQFLKEHTALNYDAYSCAERVEKAFSEILENRNC